MANKQTAVEWLVEQLTENGKYPFLLTEDVMSIEQAKQMEKEQIEKAWDSAYYGDACHDGEQYYNETFKSE